MVSTLDFESNNPSSILGMSFFVNPNYNTQQPYHRDDTTLPVFYLMFKTLLLNSDWSLYISFY